MRLLLLGLILLAIPSALSLKLAVSPEVLLFGKDRTAHAFTLLNPNDEPLTVDLSLQEHPGVFSVHPGSLTLLPHSSERLQVHLERPLRARYVEDLLLVSVVQEGYPVTLRPGVGIRLSALGQGEPAPVDTGSAVRTVVKEPKGNPLLAGAAYSLLVLALLASLVLGFRKRS